MDIKKMVDDLASLTNQICNELPKQTEAMQDNEFNEVIKTIEESMEKLDTLVDSICEDEGLANQEYIEEEE